MLISLKIPYLNCSNTMHFHVALDSYRPLPGALGSLSAYGHKSNKKNFFFRFFFAQLCGKERAKYNITGSRKYVSTLLGILHIMIPDA
jgi:hypothetical protein